MRLAIEIDVDLDQLAHALQTGVDGAAKLAGDMCTTAECVASFHEDAVALDALRRALAEASNRH